MKKIYQYMLMAAALLALASCSQPLVNSDSAGQSISVGGLQFVVGDFPVFGGGTQTRAIGIQDEGKTEWENGDKILVHLYSDEYGQQAVTLTFENGGWKSDGGTFDYPKDEMPEITAVYAPDCEIKSDKTIGLLEGKQYGEAEYIPAKTTVDGLNVSISFKDVTRTYSRLRIAGLANQTLTVTTTDFTPAGATEVATAAYTLITDNNGNAFLYGVFAEGATVIVKQGDITLKDYTFTAEKNPNGTEHNKSYALDATPVIDGTLGGKTTVTEDEVNALVEQLKAYVDNGITMIVVTGSEPAMINWYYKTVPAYARAICLLTYDLDEMSKYFGTIDLIIPDVTEIVDSEFEAAAALNSVTLPKVTKLGDLAFYGCFYMKQLTFGSVLTEVNETGGVMFHMIGDDVGGCDLILNCGQMNESSVSAPDLTNNTWKFKFENEFKSITLTHTGDCDECKANQ